MKFMHMKTTSIKVFKTLTLTTALACQLFLSACITTDGNGATTTKTVTPDNKKADIYAELARNYMMQEQYQVAESEISKALDIMPNHSESNYIMGLLMIETQQYARVEPFMERAVENDQGNSSAAHDFGVFLCKTGQELRSVSYFDKAVSNPYFERPELSLMRAGECLSKVDQPVRAEQYLKQALKRNSRMRPALINLAQIKYDTQSYLSARAYVERYFAITKPQPAALLLAYKIESELGANDVANKYRTQLLESFPASKQARDLRTRSN